MKVTWKQKLNDKRYFFFRVRQSFIGLTPVCNNGETAEEYQVKREKGSSLGDAAAAPNKRKL
jgi:hypothetical protein